MFYDKVKKSADYIRERISVVPETAIILGSGLGGIVDIMEDKVVIPYSEIPEFPQSTVAGHAGNLVIGKIGNSNTAVDRGRINGTHEFYLTEILHQSASKNANCKTAFYN